MHNFSNDELWFPNLIEQFDKFIEVLDAKIEKEEKQLKARIKNNEIENKMAHELKIHNELREYLGKLSRRQSDLDRVCAMFKTRLTIADSDQDKLNNAKDTVQVAKDITGVRPMFSAPLTIAKGYIKSHSTKVLQPFEFSAGDSGALWTLIKDTATPGWPVKAKKCKKQDGKKVNEIITVT